MVKIDIGRVYCIYIKAFEAARFHCSTDRVEIRHRCEAVCGRLYEWGDLNRVSYDCIYIIQLIV